MICDEPTSALDPIGRKEILDILSSLREQTTVIFSTHILSDVDRICTDAAFLDDGIIKISGKLSLIKEKYRTDEYILLPKHQKDLVLIKNAFPKIKEIDTGLISFTEDCYNAREILGFIAKENIPFIKIEQRERSLEDLFLGGAVQ